MVNIYELLNRIIVNKRYSLSPNLFIEADRTELSEEERSIFDLLKNIVSLGTKIHNDGIEFHPMFVMADGSRTFSIEDISEDDYLILHSLKLEKMPLILRALIADILWTNKKEFNAAKIAANAYWELFTLWYRDDDNVGTIDIIRRAVCISAQTKQTLLFEKIQGWFVDFLEKKAANNDGFFALRVGLGFPKNLRVTLKTMMENIIMGLEFDPREAILHHEEGIDVIPSNKLLSGMDMSLFTVEDREKVLKEYLELLENDYDYILIDCMPSLGMMTINALSAADGVLIPVQPQYYAADGLMELLKVVKGIHQRFNPDLQIEGILFTMDSSHYNNSKRNKQAVRDAYGAEIIIFDQTIPRTEALAETASEGVSIFSYDAKGKGAYSYQALVQEVLNHA